VPKPAVFGGDTGGPVAPNPVRRENAVIKPPTIKLCSLSFRVNKLLIDESLTPRRLNTVRGGAVRDYFLCHNHMVKYLVYSILMVKFILVAKYIVKKFVHM